jgi:hypothetical protein
MKVLVACEYSGTVRDAFIKLGHDAISCDLLPTDIPGPHYQGDIFDIINDGFDLMIAHPPCTYLCNSGVCWLHKDKTRWDKMRDGAIFFKRLLDCNIPKICIENPVSVISSRIRKPEQIIQPWQFGDEFQKTTCLWLKNLPQLIPTKIVGKGEFVTFESGKRMPKWYSNAKGKSRSKTFPGIAQAMATQWGKL